MRKQNKIKNFIWFLIIFFALSGCVLDVTQDQLEAKNQTIDDDKSLPMITITPTGVNGVGQEPVVPATSFNQKPECYSVLFFAINTDNPILVDLQTENELTLQIPGDRIIQFIKWSNMGCEFYVLTSQQKILRIRSDGLDSIEILDLSEFQSDGSIFKVAMSISEEWVAFVIGSGYQGYIDYEFQDIVTIQINTKERQYYSLTNSGGAWQPAWNPRSDLIAFSDYNSDSVIQIYVSNPDGSDKKAVTQFSDNNIDLKEIRWSPDGEKIAFRVSNKEMGGSQLALIDIKDSTEVDYIKGIEGFGAFWWDSDTSVIVDAVIGYGEMGRKNRAILQYNTDTGVEINRLESGIVSQGFEELPGMFLQSDEIGFLSNNRFYVYAWQLNRWREIKLGHHTIKCWTVSSKWDSSLLDCYP